MADMTDPPDWPDLERLSAEGQDAVAAGEELIRRALNEVGNAGHFMRGVMVGIADHFETRHLDRGMANTLRGTRNAFAEVVRRRNA